MSFLGHIKILMLKGEKGDTGTPGSAGNYSTLTNKPKINNVDLVGNKTSDDLGLASVARVEALEDEVESLVIGEWTDLTITDPQNLVASGSVLKYRKDASGLVTIAGNIEFTGSGTSVTLATLPEEITPASKANGGLSIYRDFDARFYRVNADDSVGGVHINGSTLSVSGNIVSGSIMQNPYTVFEVSYYPKF